MPLCPQITITPITVTSTGMVETSVVAAADPATTEQLATTSASAAAAAAAAAAANATAVAAQATATTALANAATAFNAAVASLQPSANTIVNAQNQMTAIASNGITVFSGASATTGARVVLNSVGLAGFNSSNAATFSISATTGAAVFSGSVTGSTITGGTLNIAGNAIIDAAGLLTATGATINGTIVSNNATITGGSLVVGSTFSVTSAGVLTASSGTVGGFTLSATSIFSSTNLVIETSGQISGGNSSTIFYGFANIGGGSVTGERLIVSGNSSFVGQTIATGNVTSQTHFYTPFASTTSSSANAFINTASTPAGRLMRSTSSMRYKTDIQQQEINPFSVLKLEPKSFYDKKEYEDNNNLTDGLKRYFGLIAEEVALIPELASLLVSYDKSNIPDSVNYDRIGVALIPLLKNLNARLTNLEGE